MGCTETWYRGQTVRKVLSVSTDGEARTLADATSVELEVKSALGGPDPAPIALGIGTGITLRDQDDEPGVADVVITSAQIQTLTPGVWWFDVVVVWPSPAERAYVVPPTKVIVAAVVNQP